MSGIGLIMSSIVGNSPTSPYSRFSSLTSIKSINTFGRTYRCIFWLEQYKSLYYLAGQNNSDILYKITFNDPGLISAGINEQSLGTAFSSINLPVTGIRGTTVFNNKLYQTAWGAPFIRKINIINGTTFSLDSSTNINNFPGTNGSWGLAYDVKRKQFFMSGNRNGYESPVTVNFDPTTETISTTCVSLGTTFGIYGDQGAFAIDPETGHFYISESYTSNVIGVFDSNFNFIETISVSGLTEIGSITCTKNHLFITGDNTAINKIFYMER